MDKQTQLNALPHTGGYTASVGNNGTSHNTLYQTWLLVIFRFVHHTTYCTVAEITVNTKRPT